MKLRSSSFYLRSPPRYELSDFFLGLSTFELSNTLIVGGRCELS